MRPQCWTRTHLAWAAEVRCAPGAAAGHRARPSPGVLCRLCLGFHMAQDSPLWSPGGQRAGHGILIIRLTGHRRGAIQPEGRYLVAGVQFPSQPPASAILSAFSDETQNAHANSLRQAPDLRLQFPGVWPGAWHRARASKTIMEGFRDQIHKGHHKGKRPGNDSHQKDHDQKTGYPKSSKVNQAWTEAKACKSWQSKRVVRLGRQALANGSSMFRRLH